MWEKLNLDVLIVIIGFITVVALGIKALDLLSRIASKKLYKSVTQGYPHIDQYIADNANKLNVRGIGCRKCNSSNIRNHGATSRRDTLRLVSCNSCGTKLYHMIEE